LNACLLLSAIAAALPLVSSAAPPATGGGDGMSAFIRAPSSALCPGVPAGDLTRVPFGEPASAKCPAAKVGDEAITLGELFSVVAATHGGKDTPVAARRADPTAILNRLIEGRLLVAEAREMGIADLPEIRSGFENTEREILARILKERVTAGVKPDTAAVDRVYRDSVREWRIRSLLFEREDVAKAFLQVVRDAPAFEAEAKKVLAAKKAMGTDADEWVVADKMLPVVAKALSAVKVGKVVGPIKVGGGWAVVALLGERYPENAALRAEKTEISLAEQRTKVLRKYYADLLKKHVKVDEALVKKVDYDGPKPGIDALRKDQRVLVRIDGAPAIRVADLTKLLEKEFFHGIDGAIKEKRVNAQKKKQLDAEVGQIIVPAEARRLGIANTDEYRFRVTAAENSLLFGKFVERVVAPDVKVSDAEVSRYYEAHLADFRTPASYKLEGIGFGTAAAAEAARTKLQAGTDFTWLNANAEGKLAPEAAKIQFGPAPASEKAMVATMAQALSGARKGDYRVFNVDGKQFYVAHVLDVTPSATAPLVGVKGEITEKLYDEALAKAVKTWAEKLRAANPVVVYLDRIGNG